MLGATPALGLAKQNGDELNAGVPSHCQGPKGEMTEGFAFLLMDENAFPSVFIKQVTTLLTRTHDGSLTTLPRVLMLSITGPPKSHQPVEEGRNPPVTVPGTSQ
jgi:hypothetical protein